MEKIGNIIEDFLHISTKISFKCEFCDYLTSKKKDLLKHVFTAKHGFHILETFLSKIIFSSKTGEILFLIYDAKNSENLSPETCPLAAHIKVKNKKTKIVKNWEEIEKYYTFIANLLEKTPTRCEECDAEFLYKENKDRHIKLEHKKYFNCEFCKKIYKTRSGLYKHRHKNHLNELCEQAEHNHNKQNDVRTTSDNAMVVRNTNTQYYTSEDRVSKLTNLVEVLITENKELQNQLVEIAKEPRVINNNQTINRNKQFNIITFLNNDCKDAFNLSEFIKNLEITFEDLEYIEINGYVQGIRESLVKTLANMEETKRPIHCTDTKRKHFYVKDNDEWDKDKTHNKINQAINEYNTNQLKTLSNWKKSKPRDNEHNTDTYNSKMMSLINEVTQMYQPTGDKVRKRIINDIGNATTIEKTLHIEDKKSKS